MAHYVPYKKLFGEGHLNARAVLMLMTVAIFSCSCQQTAPSLNADPVKVLSSFGSWWQYNYSHIKLSADYKALDTLGKPLTKVQFLQSLASGDFVAFKIKSRDTSPTYKLYRLDPSVHEDIRLQVKQIGADGYLQFQMEGTAVPDFNFTDLHGQMYNRQNTLGKIVVIKCWFIHCTVCIQEMPALNAIVEEFRPRKDIVFLSLAFDSKDKLEAFLKKTRFEYAVAPVAPGYMEEKLKVTAYPTHIVINKKGLITKVVNEYREMVTVLRKEASL